jgi:hypothetical protein
MSSYDSWKARQPDDLGDAEQRKKVTILTSFVYPPIPVRDYDWLAWYAGEEDYDMHSGSGRTEQEAIDDLIENYEPI